MWVKPLIIIILFYFFAVLQNSFFAHFSLLGTAPKLVFIFFLLLVFFVKNNDYRNIFFFAVLAGFFLDVFSYSYIGISIVLLIFIGFLAKKVHALLQEKEGNKFPFVYFLPIFVVSLAIYEALLRIILDKFSLSLILFDFNLVFVAGLVYNSVIASVGFYLYKNFAYKDSR
jgi:rod shape-determining protein MreD